jgi:hypothetical protein
MQLLLTHFENAKTAGMIIFPYLGWLIAIVVSYFWWGQKQEIKGLRETIKVLKAHDKQRTKKDKIRDDLLQEMVKVIADQNLADDRKKRIEELFGDLLKPWSDYDEETELK